jgi:hypothetical protein
MPSSHWQQINEILGVIISLKPRSMLDIGIGFGKFGVLAREYLELWDGRSIYNDWKCKIDGVEIFKEYRNPIHDYVYDNVYYGNVLNIIFGIPFHYDLILLVDVLEHFTKENGLKLLKFCEEMAGCVLVVTPHKVSAQKAVFGNEYETHRSQWQLEDLESFKGIKVNNSRSLIYYFGDSVKTSK